MNNLFNAICDVCKTFRPYCAVVYFRAIGKSTMDPNPVIICEPCRHERKGRYRLDSKHTTDGQTKGGNGK